jgi:hypothetical protein
MLRTGALISSDRAAPADADMLSVTLTLKLDEPGAMGVPLIMPPAKRNPAGTDPLTIDHVYGGFPPIALMACEYAVPTVPAGSVDVVIFKIGALIVSNSTALADAEALSVTRTVKLDEPDVTGVPEMTPPARLNPEGSSPLAKDHIYGAVPPVALSVCK